MQKMVWPKLGSASHWFTILLLIVGFAQATEYFCPRNETPVAINNQSTGDIYTRYEGDSHYVNNMVCLWLIDAGPGNRVEITVLSSELQWANQNAICPGYDHVAIKDGDDGGEESIVLQWCGHAKPLGAVSSGRYVRVEFMSDKNNPYQYSGVHVKFQTFSSDDCAPSWISIPSGFCLKVVGTEKDWSSAQRACNAENANLASIHSDQEHQYVMQNISSGVEKVWIGLNDIAQPGTYQWIDHSDTTFRKFKNDHSSHEYRHCVALHFKLGTWQVHNCDSFMAKPLCKANKGNETTLYRIPQVGGTDNTLPKGVIIAIILVVVLVITIIVGCVVYYKMRDRRKKKSQSHVAYQAAQRTEPTAPDREAPEVRIGHVVYQTPQRSRPTSPAVEQRPGVVVMVVSDCQIDPPAYNELVRHQVITPPPGYG